MTVERCKGRTKDGKPCAAKPRPGTDLCPWHDPQFANRRAEWSRRGGVNSSTKARARKQLPSESLTIDEIHGYLGRVFTGVIEGKLEPSVATAAANVARAMLDVAKVADFESQLTDLRRSIAELQEAEGA